VEDIATKMAACDVLRHHDYSGLILSSGVDKIPIESKVRLMQEEIETKIDSLTAISVW